MATKTRRSVLKGLGLALPATWARPVVEAVILPAHAQTTSPESSTPGICGAPEGCYLYEGGSFSWPGGAGPFFSVPFYEGEGTGCTGESAGTAAIVVAASQTEAQEALGSSVAPGEIPTDPALTGGCSFFGIG